MLISLGWKEVILDPATFVSSTKLIYFLDLDGLLQSNRLQSMSFCKLKQQHQQPIQCGLMYPLTRRGIISKNGRLPTKPFSTRRLYIHNSLFIFDARYIESKTKASSFTDSTR